MREARTSSTRRISPVRTRLRRGPPGSLKSPALAEALRPLHRLVTDAHAQYEEQMLAHHFRVSEQKARRHDLARRPRTAVEDEAPSNSLGVRTSNSWS